jgi:spore germination protein KB
MMVSVRQFTILAMFFTVGTTILIIPAGLAAVAGNDAWMAALLGSLVGLAIVLFFIAVGKRMEGMTFVEYTHSLYGPVVGTALVLPLIFFSFIGSATLLSYIGNFVTTQVMPETPIQFINILFAAVVMMGLRSGLETIARAAEVFFPWFIMLFLIFVVLIIPDTKLSNLEPVLNTSLPSMAKAVLAVIATASLPMVVLLMFFPKHIRHRDGARRGLLVGSAVGGVVIVLITLLCIAVMGAESTARQQYPSYVLARKISIADFFQRIESILAGIWILSIYFKITLYSYACVTGLAQTLKLKDYRPLALPFGMILVVMSLVVYPNVVYMAEWDSTIYPPYAVALGFLYPLLIMALGAFKRK